MTSSEDDGGQQDSRLLFPDLGPKEMAELFGEVGEQLSGRDAILPATPLNLANPPLVSWRLPLCEVSPFEPGDVLPEIPPHEISAVAKRLQAPDHTLPGEAQDPGRRQEGSMGPEM